MPSGGHARSGPPAQPGSARTDARGLTWTKLPIKGRGRKRAPEFPLEDPTVSESALWASLWRKPQAVMWEQLGQEFQVAAYTRAFLESTVAGAPASLKVSVLRMEDTLGLSIVGMNALRWQFAEDELKAQRSTRRPTAAVEAAPVRRLRAS